MFHGDVMDERTRDEILSEAWATLDRTQHLVENGIVREQANVVSYDLPDDRPAGADFRWWRKYQQRQESERNAKAAKAREQATRDATPFTELQMEVIADALSEIRFQLREEIKSLRSEVASLRERTGNVTVLPNGKNAA
jgi:hypothetical protein